MQRLIHVLLALARDKDVKAADNDIKYLPDIAREIQEEDEPDARQKGLRMVIDDRSGTPPPRLSDSFASCVLSNLVRNAVRNSTRGTITITLEPTRFSVKDEGCGIPKDEMEKIFLPFTRGKLSHGQGHGIGLSLVSRICTRMGWKISVESEEGKGSLFTITFAEKKTPF
jgi:signal transduction histidine kinase